MFEIDYELAKRAFARKSRIDDSHSGSFTVIGVINLDEVRDDVTSLDKKVAGAREKIEAFYFEGSGENDPLKKLYLVERVKKHLNKTCQVTTSAPKRKFLSKIQAVEEFETIDKIIIKRVNIDDIKNSETLKEVALTLENYQEMDPKLKEKCSFLVDCDQANITGIDHMRKFVMFSQNAGINEIAFVAEKTLQHNPQLFMHMRNWLIKNGWHFEINKAISGNEEFYTKVTLFKGNMKVMFKQRIDDRTLQLRVWSYSRSHKYIVNL